MYISHRATCVLIQHITNAHLSRQPKNIKNGALNSLRSILQLSFRTGKKGHEKHARYSSPYSRTNENLYMVLD
jgi:hypothetical protein